VREVRRSERVLAEAEALCRGSGALDLRLGEVLLRFVQRDGPAQLCFSTISDYAKGRLGVAPSLAFRWMRLARELADRALLRRAVKTGLVSATKAGAVMNAAVGENEARWTAAAAFLSLKELKQRVEQEGHEPEFDEFDCQCLIWQMTDEQRAVLDQALLAAKFVHGFATSPAKRMEAMAQEFLGAYGHHDPYFCSRMDLEKIDVKPGLERLFQRCVLPEAEELPEDVFALDAEALDLIAQRNGRDEKLGRLLAEIHHNSYYIDLGYRWFCAYVSERLLMSPRTARDRIVFESQLREFPSLREAYRKGEISRAMAERIAKDATPEDIDERIADARTKTDQQHQREHEEEQDRRDRGAGRCRVKAGKEAAETIAYAIGCAQAVFRMKEGNPIGPGEALAVIAEHFLDVWRPQLNVWKSKTSDKRERILLRHGGFCAAPHCSRAAQHVHHIELRSRGGSNDEDNGLALCAFHHLWAIHQKGFLVVYGKAGKLLRWEFLTTGQVWETVGDDDVRWVAEETSTTKKKKKRGGASGQTGT